MKALLTLSVLVFGLTASANLDQSDLVPAVGNAKVVISGGGGLAAVQPVAMLNFTVNSCAKRDLSVETTKQGRTVFVKVLDSAKGDCRALGRDHQYSLQVSSDATMENYVLVNPIAAEYVQ